MPVNEMKLYVPEILKEIKDKIKKPAKKKILEKYRNDKTLKWILWGTFHPSCEWYFHVDLPEYTPDDAPYGHTVSNLNLELKRLSIFRKGDPLGEKMTREKKTSVLIQILESIHPEEAKVIRMMFRKIMKVGIDLKMLQEVWPEEFKEEKPEIKEEKNE